VSAPQSRPQSTVWVSRGPHGEYALSGGLELGDPASRVHVSAAGLTEPEAVELARSWVEQGGGPVVALRGAEVADGDPVMTALRGA
jgi:hypothetical protein